MLGTHAITVGSTNALRKHSRIKSYVVGVYSDYIVTEDNILYGSGEAAYGQLGQGFGNTKGYVPIASDVVEVKTSSYQTCYLNKSKQLYAFGQNSHSQMGLDDTNHRSAPTLIATDVIFFTVGTYNIWYINSSNQLYAAGYNGGYGPFGIGSTVSRYPTFQLVASNAAAVSACVYNAAYLSTTGVLYFAGRNQYGEAGLGDTDSRTTWTQVDTGVTDFTMGNVYMTYLKGTNLYVSGYNVGATYSTIGLGAGVVNITTPQLLTTNVSKAICAQDSGNFTMVLKTDDTLWAVGFGANGRTSISNSHALTQIASNVYDFDCRFAATVYQSNSGVWFKSGTNSWNQSRDTMCTYQNTGFTRVSLFDDPENVMDVEAQNIYYNPVYNVAAYINKAGDLYMIGYNASGNFGIGDQNNRTRWTLVLQDVTSVAVGFSHTLAIKKDGSVWGTGQNTYGQLGDGTGTNTVVWVQVKPASDEISQVAVGLQHSACMSFSQQKLWMTGDNTYGQFGNSTNTSSDEWVEVTLVSVPIKVVCGAYHSIVKGNTYTYTTGRNNYGQLGLGLDVSTDVNVFTQATTANAPDIDASGYSTYIGNQFAGHNTAGQGAIGNTTSPITTLTASLLGSSFLEAGYRNAYSLQFGQAVVGAGYNGVFGDGYTGSNVLTDRELGHKGFSGDLVKLAAGDLMMLAVDKELKLSITTSEGGIEMGLPQDDYPTFRRHMADKTPLDIFGLSEQLGTSYRDGVVYMHDADAMKLEQVLLGATSVAGEDNNTLVVKGNKLFVKGTNSEGQLGTGSATAVNSFNLAGTWSNFIRVKAALNASMLLDGTVIRVAGYNLNGMFGLGNTTQMNTWTPTGVWTNVVDFAISQKTALVIDGTTVKAAGNNQYNQLGLADTENKTSWTTTGTWTNPRLVACSPYSSYVVDGNTLYVVGHGGRGQLGNGTSSITSWTTSGTWTNIRKVVALNTMHSPIRQAFVLDGTNLYITGTGPNGLGNLKATHIAWTLVARDVRDVWVGTAGVVYCDLRGRLFATGNDGSKLGFVDNSAVPYWKELVRPLTSGTYTLNVDGMKLVDSSGESLTIDL